MSFSFFFNDTATTEIYTLSLHDALPISRPQPQHGRDPRAVQLARLRSQRLRRRHRSRRLAPPQREREPPALRPLDPGSLSARLDLETRRGGDRPEAGPRHLP